MRAGGGSQGWGPLRNREQGTPQFPPLGMVEKCPYGAEGGCSSYSPRWGQQHRAPTTRLPRPLLCPWRDQPKMGSIPLLGEVVWDGASPSCTPQPVHKQVSREGPEASLQPPPPHCLRAGAMGWDRDCLPLQHRLRAGRDHVPTNISPPGQGRGLRGLPRLWGHPGFASLELPPPGTGLTRTNNPAAHPGMGGRGGRENPQDFHILKRSGSKHPARETVLLPPITHTPHQRDGERGSGRAGDSRGQRGCFDLARARRGRPGRGEHPRDGSRAGRQPRG